MFAIISSSLSELSVKTASQYPVLFNRTFRFGLLLCRIVYFPKEGSALTDTHVIVVLTLDYFGSLADPMEVLRADVFTLSC